MASRRLNVFCASCGRLVMRADRIESDQLDRLRMHLRAVHSVPLLHGTEGVLKHFRVRARDEQQPPS